MVKEYIYYLKIWLIGINYYILIIIMGENKKLNFLIIIKKWLNILSSNYYSIINNNLKNDI